MEGQKESTNPRPEPARLSQWAVRDRADIRDSTFPATLANPRWWKPAGIQLKAPIRSAFTGSPETSVRNSRTSISRGSTGSARSMARSRIAPGIRLMRLRQYGRRPARRARARSTGFVERCRSQLASCVRRPIPSMNRRIMAILIWQDFALAASLFDFDCARHLRGRLIRSCHVSLRFSVCF